MTTPDQISFPSELTTRIGEAIEAYAKVEGMLALLFQRILKIDMQRAYLIIFSIQNSRARDGLFGDLLAMEYSGKLDEYWESCSLFLGKLAKFRNAIAHWHPIFNVFEHEKTGKLKFEHAMAHPNLKTTLGSIGALEIGPFLVDCWKIRGRLSDLEVLMRERPDALPERFQQPIPDRNLAVLQTPPKPKGSKPPRPPSVLKLSRAQKRAKALKNARGKKK
jgi:hypothetical protein